ncbi:MAG: GTP-binding protein [Candidatus Lokiarchaeota archaeon]|nr:GTP-binding protein [Candidatus Lokiarchaeota archaeon]
MENKKKTPVHIGLFGHIDSGKTELASSLSEVISTAGIDAHPQSKERGITIDLGFTSLVLGDYLVTLVDGPGHADLIKISASSVEIIDCAIIVIDINKGPQVQTGEHIIMIESLDIKNLIVVLNKTDIFKGEVAMEIKKARNFFATTDFGTNVPIYPISAKKKEGVEELKNGILETIKKLEIKREIEANLVIPIDHHFPIKGMGAILTGTVLSGRIKVGQTIHVLPIQETGRVKSIEVFHQGVESAEAGDRVGVNMKNLELNKVYRGCIMTDDEKSFTYTDIIEVQVKKSALFKPETRYGTQVHLTIGMNTIVGNIYPYYEDQGKKIQTSIPNNIKEFKAFLLLNEKILLRNQKTTILLSRLDLPPSNLRILGSASLLNALEEGTTPVLHKFKVKEGRITNPYHSQGIICTGLAQSAIGAKKEVGKRLEPPFTKVLATFGTKGAVIVGVSPNTKIDENDPVILKELRQYRLKKI